jgi:hypothetical protein
MKIDCYLSEHCGSYHELNERISASLKELGLAADVEFHTVCTADDAAALGVPGSPTIRINGRDIVSGGSPGIT